MMDQRGLPVKSNLPTSDELTMAEALRDSNAENQKLRDALASSNMGYAHIILVSLIVVILAASTLAPDPPNYPPPVESEPSPAPIVVTRPFDTHRCNRMWSMVHGGDDIHIEDGTGEIVVEFEYITHTIGVSSNMDSLSGNQIRRVLAFTQEMVDIHNQELE